MRITELPWAIVWAGAAACVALAGVDPRPATAPSIPGGAASTQPAPPSKAMVALADALVEVEQTVGESEKALAAFAESTDPNVQLAADAVRLRLAAVRGLRQIMTKYPTRDVPYTMGIVPDRPRQWKAGIDYYLSCAKTGTDPFAGMSSGVRTCRSRIDGQLLFYKFKLPANYDAGKKYPLDVYLHYSGELMWQATAVDGRPQPGDAARAPTSPFYPGRPLRPEDGIWIFPCARGENSYMGLGETAVLEVLDDVCRRYSVDPDRIVIGGASMGASGALRFATFYPDRFAAAYDLTSGGPAWRAPQGNGRFDSLVLLDNLANLGLCVWNEPSELKSYGSLYRGLDDLAARYPGCYQQVHFTDPKGVHGNVDRQQVAEGGQWLKARVRNRYPRLVNYKTCNLRYDGAYWAHLDTMENPAAPARIEAQVQDTGGIRVTVENADRFHLDLAKELFGQIGEAAVTVNGGPALRVPTGQTAFFARNDGQWAISKDRYPAGLLKKHGLSGPVLDVFMEHPVLMVYGTTPGGDAAKAERALDDAVGRLFGPRDGGAFFHTLFARKADRDVTDQDIARSNLVLWGAPRQNALLARFADKLPVKFLDDGVEIAGKQYRGAGIGLILVYPNPLNPQRYVLLMPENYEDARLAHAESVVPLLHLYPDYAVTVPGNGGWDSPTFKVLAQGSFDAHWQLPGPKP